MMLLLIGAFLSVLSTIIIIAIQREQAVLAGFIASLTTYLNVMAIVQIVGGSDGIWYAIGTGIGATGTVYWNKKRGAI